MKRTALAVFLILIISMPLSAFSQSTEKIGLAILDVDAIGISEIEARALSEKLRSSLSQFILNSQGEQWNNYELIERSQMDKIFEQFEIQNTGCTDINCAVEFGKMLNADRIIIGSVSHIGQSYIIALRLIDIETSKIIKSADTQHRGEIDDIINLIGRVGTELFTNGNGAVAQETPSQPVRTQQQPSQQAVRREPAVSAPAETKKHWGEFTIGAGFDFILSEEKDYYKSNGDYNASLELFFSNTASILVNYNIMQLSPEFRDDKINVKDYGVDLVLESNGREKTTPVLSIGYGRWGAYTSDHTFFRSKVGVEFGGMIRRFFLGARFSKINHKDSDTSLNEVVAMMKYEYKKDNFFYYSIIEYITRKDTDYDGDPWEQIRFVPFGFGYAF